MNRINMYRCSAILTSILVMTGTTVAAPFSELVVFGDSLSDTGNANLGFLGGGVAAVPPYFDGNFTNGPVWVEVLADRLGLPAPEPSLAGGTNYAWGGAETGPGLSFFGTPNVGMQINSFVADRGRFHGDELIVVAAGSNDFTWQPPWGVGHAVKNLRAHIADLAAIGGTTFLIANSPAAGHLPTQFNKLLDRELARLDDRLKVTILPFDMASVEAAMRQNPADFGLTNLTDPACPGCGIGIPAPDAADTIVPNPDEYFFWDDIHRTRVVHRVVGEAAAVLFAPSAVSLVPSVPEPSAPVVLFLAACTFVTIPRRRRCSPATRRQDRPATQHHFRSAVRATQAGSRSPATTGGWPRRPTASETFAHALLQPLG
jgi:phospholipase/lecithinase/hemolysin